LNGQEYVSPLQRATELDVDNLFVEVEEFDCLHDEGKLLYEKAKESVSKSTLLDNKGTFHAYDKVRLRAKKQFYEYKYAGTFRKPRHILIHDI
jgi:acetyl esterase/lipase